jgi:hypothetical protein
LRTKRCSKIISLFVSFVVLFLIGSAVEATSYSTNLNDLTGHYPTLDDKWSGDSYLGKEQVISFGQPYTSLKTFVIRLTGQVTFPLYRWADGSISAGPIICNFNMSDVAQTAQLYLDFVIGIIISETPYYEYTNEPEYQDHDIYTIDGNKFTYTRVLTDTDDLNWKSGFPSGQARTGLIFMHLPGDGVLVQEGSVNITEVDITLNDGATFWVNEGTTGTQFVVTGTGFGTKKGKVLIGNIATNIAKNGWADDFIIGTVNKNPPQETYDITIRPYKANDIVLPDAFTVKPPEIDSLDYTSGVAGVPITISGNFFGTKKGKVYLEYEDKYGKLRKKKCKVTFWDMGTITFLVPKTSKSFPPGTYSLKVMNKIGTAASPIDVTID